MNESAPLPAETARLLAEVETYCAASGMAEATLGRKAVNDGKFVRRLRAGGRAWPETADRVRQFIAGSCQSVSPTKGAA